MTTAYWLAAAWISASLGSLLGYIAGRAFQREEWISMQLENITLRGMIDRESQKAAAAEERARQAVLRAYGREQRAVAPREAQETALAGRAWEGAPAPQDSLSSLEQSKERDGASR